MHCSIFLWPSLLSKNYKRELQWAVTFALADTFLHYKEHRRRGLFWVGPPCTDLLWIFSCAANLSHRNTSSLHLQPGLLELIQYYRFRNVLIVFFFQKHSHDMSSPRHAINLILLSSPWEEASSESCSCPLSDTHNLSALFLLSTISWGKYLPQYLQNAPLCWPVTHWLWLCTPGW